MTHAHIYLTLCAVLMVLAPYMIFATCYEDGIVGKLALGMVWFAASAVVLRALFEWLLPPIEPRAVLSILAGMTVFMLRHLTRFWRHCKRERRPT